MILLYVLLGLLALLLLAVVLLLIPVRLVLTYREKGSATLRYLFFRIDVKDLVEKLTSSEEKEKPQDEAPKATPSQGKKGDLLGFLSFVGRVIRVLTLAVKEQLEGSKLVVKEFYLILGTDDAAKTALLYGAATTAANCLLAVLDRFTRLVCHNERMVISPDFTKEETRFSIHVELHFRFLHLIGVILRAQSRLFERKDVQHARNSVKTGH